MIASTKGICPHCESSVGEVFTPCIEKGCSKHGYHLISSDSYAKRGSRGADQLLGQVIDNKYLITERLGRGGMGSVFVALQKPLNREVAIKLLTEVELDESSRERFEREARAISILDHPNIVKLYDYGVARLNLLEKEFPYMVVEYIKSGMTLRQFFIEAKNTGKKITNDILIAIFDQILNALIAAHKNGIVHRDIKPENIMLKEVEGNPHMVKVLDFGLVKSIDIKSGFEQNLTMKGVFLGSPHYMAPEQIGMFGEGRVDQRTDLYSLGVILYEIFCGVKPFASDTIPQTLYLKTNVNYDPLEREEAKLLDPSIKTFLTKAMAREPNKRFPDAVSFGEAMKIALRLTSQKISGLTETRGLGSSKEVQDQRTVQTLRKGDEPAETIWLDSREKRPKRVFGAGVVAVSIIFLIALLVFLFASMSSQREDMSGAGRAAVVVPEVSLGSASAEEVIDTEEATVIEISEDIERDLEETKALDEEMAKDNETAQVEQPEKDKPSAPVRKAAPKKKQISPAKEKGKWRL